MGFRSSVPEMGQSPIYISIINDNITGTLDTGALFLWPEWTGFWVQVWDTHCVYLSHVLLSSCRSAIKLTSLLSHPKSFPELLPWVPHTHWLAQRSCGCGQVSSSWWSGVKKKGRGPGAEKDLCLKGRHCHTQRMFEPTVTLVTSLAQLQGGVIPLSQ